MKQLSIVILHAPEDRLHFAKLQSHLYPPTRLHGCHLWTAEQIAVGGVRNEELGKAFEQATAIVLLLSADLLGCGDYAVVKDWLDRFPSTLERIVPVIVRPCNWQQEPFGARQRLPRRHSSFMQIPSEEQEAEWLSAAQAVVERALELAAAKPASPTGGVHAPPRQPAVTAVKPSTSPESWKDLLAASAHRHGKVALLIEDGADGAARVGRELYGTEDLPAFWHFAASMKCAADAMEALAAVMSEIPGLRALLVMDRYLQRACRGAGPVEHGGRAEAWDISEPNDPPDLRSLRNQVQSALGNLQYLERQGQLIGRLVTSYEHAAGRGSLHDPAQQSERQWQPRRLWPLFQLRVDLQRPQTTSLPWRGFLVRGPGRPDDRLGWPSALDDIMKRLGDGRPVALMLGWATSEARAPYAPGLPHWLLAGTAPSGESGSSPTHPYPCRCRGIGRAQPSPLRRTAEELTALAGDAYGALRRDLRGFDTGFAHHHWLLAGLPWAGVLTTAADGYFERAVAARWSAADLGPGVDTELGLRVDWSRLEAGSAPGQALRSAAQARSGKLYKLFGGAFEPGVDRQRALDEARRLGDRMDLALSACFEGSDDAALVLVEADPYETKEALAAAERARCKTVYIVANEAPDATGSSTLLEGSVVDLAHDLWALQRTRR